MKIMQELSGTRGRNVLPVFALGIMLAHMPAMAQEQSGSGNANAANEPIEEMISSARRPVSSTR
jgi:hypothetical protein